MIKNNHLFGLVLGLCMLCISLYSPVYAQLTPLSATVSIDGKILKMPFLGGLNAPQFSTVDFNQDGRQDLYIFDRVGGVHLGFDYQNQEWVYKADWTANFPNLNDWVLLRDYNGDGIQDIFAQSTIPGINGIEVYRGYQDTNGLIAFEKVGFDNFDFDLLNFPLTSGNRTQLLVTAIDIPDVNDVDGDGDLDILTFNIAGGYLEWYKNLSVEKGEQLNALDFELVDDCWGGFYESGISEKVDLAPTQGSCANDIDNPSIRLRHAGSTVLSFDADGDCDRDLLLGDVSFSNINFLLNGGDCENAWMTAQNNAFPDENHPVDIPVFPAPFLVDINNDDVPELLAAPNSSRGAEDVQVAWLYEWSGRAYTFMQEDFLVDEMIDLGTGTHPAVLDYNGDGLLDLLVGVETRFQPFGEYDSRLHLFENIGTPTQPAFSLADDDYLNFSQYNSFAFGFTPTVGDLDGDGDLDLLIGETFGTLFFVENTANSTANAPIFSNIVPAYAGIDVGLASVPAIADINQDGLADLLVGERNGNINYFQNQGTIGNPIFDAVQENAPNTPQFGKIDARNIGSTTGYSAPTIITIDGISQLFTGTEAGQIEQYGTLETITTAEEIDLDFESIEVGERSRVTFADLNQDGYLEIILGNMRGGLNIYSTTILDEKPISTAVSSLESVNTLTVFPNPATTKIHLSIDEERSVIKVYNHLGQLLIHQNYFSNDFINIDHLPQGIYYIFTDNGASTKWVKVEE